MLAGSGEYGRGGATAVRTRVTLPRFGHLVQCGEALVGLVLHWM